MRRTITPNRQAILGAVNAGHTTLEDIRAAAGLSSKSVVRYNLLALAEQGHIVLDRSRGCIHVENGQEFCQGWDMAARLAGNPEA